MPKDIKELLEKDGVISTETDENKIEEIVEKPYKFRRLSFKDISPMLKILKKLDLKKLKDVIVESKVMEVIKENKEENENKLDTIRIGGDLVVELVPFFIDALDNVLHDINVLLANVANLEVEEVECMDLDVYFSMIVDFITKPEFTNFMKAVSKLMK